MTAICQAVADGFRFSRGNDATHQLCSCQRSSNGTMKVIAVRVADFALE
jgi:hypothetical protein